MKTLIGVFLAALVLPASASAANPEVYNWGSVHKGVGDWIDSTTPVLIEGLGNAPGLGKEPEEEVVQLDASNESDYVLERNGSVWAWGYDGSGDLGDGKSKSGKLESSKKPVEVKLGGFKARTVGEARASGMAINAAGEAYVWGENEQGHLCTKGAQQIIEPIHPALLTEKVVAVQGGETHTMWLTEAGKVVSCGDNRSGSLGVGKEYEGAPLLESAKPLPLELPKEAGRVVEMSAGEHQALVRTENGEVYGWGGNNWGQTCTASKEKIVYTPEKVPLPKEEDGKEERAKQISAGGDLPTDGSTLITMEDGEVYGCGFNKYGTADPMGPESKQTKLYKPTYTGYDFVQAVTGGETSYGLTAEGKLYSWGSTEDGDIGNGTTGVGEVRTPELVQEHVVVREEPRGVSATAKTVLTLVEG
jgi:alpha-tubulin suppressor-like RCC1 family protein